LPVFRFDRAIGMVQRVRAFLNLEGSVVPNAAPADERRKERVANRKRARQRKSEQKQKLKSKKKLISKRRDTKRELSQIKKELRTVKDPEERQKHTTRKKRVEAEIFKLTNELRAAKNALDDRLAAQMVGEPETGVLPDFVVIGTQKGGTTYFYNLLTRHPHVERAAMKELHYFDNSFDEGVEWYRRHFPPPRWKDGRKTITGEATPAYLFRPLVPERMAEVIPEARLIALLRNPVQRAYSQYHQRVRKGVETWSVEEAIEAEEAWLLDEEDQTSDRKRRMGLEGRETSYLARGIYVDQLLRWSRFFSKEQLLVLKSEDLFEYPQETLKTVLSFLDLPGWEPEVRRVRNKGDYTSMDPATRRRLEGYFEPHNRRLYEYLGVDFGW
jgi:hypothetical protein